MMMDSTFNKINELSKVYAELSADNLSKLVQVQSLSCREKSVQELLKQFETRFGSTQCLSLTGVHLGTEEGQAEFLQNNQIEGCLTYVKFTTRFVMDVIKSQ